MIVIKRQPFVIDKQGKIGYTNIAESKSRASYGAVKVSTGAVRYDKRSAPDNRVKMSKT